MPDLENNNEKKKLAERRQQSLRDAVIRLDNAKIKEVMLFFLNNNLLKYFAVENAVSLARYLLEDPRSRFAAVGFEATLVLYRVLLLDRRLELVNRIENIIGFKHLRNLRSQVLSSLLHRFIALEEIPAAIGLLTTEKKTNLANACDSEGNLIFFNAIRLGDEDLIKAFFRAGFDVNRVSRDGETALACAFLNENEALYSQLIEKDLSVNNYRKTLDYLLNKNDLPINKALKLLGNLPSNLNPDLFFEVVARYLQNRSLEEVRQVLNFFVSSKWHDIWLRYVLIKMSPTPDKVWELLSTLKFDLTNTRYLAVLAEYAAKKLNREQLPTFVKSLADHETINKDGVEASNNHLRTFGKLLFEKVANAEETVMDWQPENVFELIALFGIDLNEGKNLETLINYASEILNPAHVERFLKMLIASGFSIEKFFKALNEINDGCDHMALEKFFISAFQLVAVERLSLKTLDEFLSLWYLGFAESTEEDEVSAQQLWEERLLQLAGLPDEHKERALMGAFCEMAGHHIERTKFFLVKFPGLGNQVKALTNSIDWFFGNEFLDDREDSVRPMIAALIASLNAHDSLHKHVDELRKCLNRNRCDDVWLVQQFAAYGIEVPPYQQGNNPQEAARQAKAGGGGGFFPSQEQPVAVPPNAGAGAGVGAAQDLSDDEAGEDVAIEEAEDGLGKPGHAAFNGGGR